MASSSGLLQHSSNVIDRYLTLDMILNILYTLIFISAWDICNIFQHEPVVPRVNISLI